MNQINLIGNICNDLELKKTKNNKSVVDFNLAVSSGYGDFKRTDFIKVVVYGTQAENIVKYQTKGNKLMVSGELHIDKYEKDGKISYFTSVQANSVEFLTPKSDETSDKDTGEIDTSMFGGEKSDSGSNVDISSDDLPFYGG